LEKLIEAVNDLTQAFRENTQALSESNHIAREDDTPPTIVTMDDDE